VSPPLAAATLNGCSPNLTGADEAWIFGVYWANGGRAGVRMDIVLTSRRSVRRNRVRSKEMRRVAVQLRPSDPHFGPPLVTKAEPHHHVEVARRLCNVLCGSDLI